MYQTFAYFFMHEEFCCGCDKLTDLSMTMRAAVPKPVWAWMRPSKSISTSSHTFLGISGVEEPPGITASRLSHPPRTPPTRQMFIKLKGKKCILLGLSYLNLFFSVHDLLGTRTHAVKHVMHVGCPLSFVLFKIKGKFLLIMIIFVQIQKLTLKAWNLTLSLMTKCLSHLLQAFKAHSGFGEYLHVAQ